MSTFQYTALAENRVTKWLTVGAHPKLSWLNHQCKDEQLCEKISGSLIIKEVFE